MVFLAAFLVFVGLVFWFVLAINAYELRPEQVLVWKGATPLGKFARWTVVRLKPVLFGFVNIGWMVGVMAIQGGLINWLGWVAGVVPLIYDLALIFEFKSLIRAAKTVK